MAINISDIKMWGLEKKYKHTYGHIVLNQNGHWVQTACGTMTPNWPTSKEQPKRLCKKCMGKLGGLVLNK